jgi:hypothetical protein
VTGGSGRVARDSLYPATPAGIPANLAKPGYQNAATPTDRVECFDPHVGLQPGDVVTVVYKLNGLGPRGARQQGQITIRILGLHG